MRDFDFCVDKCNVSAEKYKSLLDIFITSGYINDSDGVNNFVVDFIDGCCTIPQLTNTSFCTTCKNSLSFSFGMCTCVTVR